MKSDCFRLIYLVYSLTFNQKSDLSFNFIKFYLIIFDLVYNSEFNCSVFSFI
jgi:hypothetical protein